MTTETNAPLVRYIPRCAYSSGRREAWCKHVTGIASKTERGSKAFAGSYLKSGTEYDLPAGSVIIYVEPEGSVKRAYESAFAVVLNADGTTTRFAQVENWRKQFLSFRDAVAAALKPKE